MKPPPLIRMVAAAALLSSAMNSLAAEAPNRVAGTWNLITATVENNGVTSYPYGPES